MRQKEEFLKEILTYLPDCSNKIILDPQANDGELLSLIPAKKKIGIDSNTENCAEMLKKGIQVFKGDYLTFYEGSMRYDYAVSILSKDVKETILKCLKKVNEGTFIFSKTDDIKEFIDNNLLDAYIELDDDILLIRVNKNRKSNDIIVKKKVEIKEDEKEVKEEQEEQKVQEEEDEKEVKEETKKEKRKKKK